MNDKMVMNCRSSKKSPPDGRLDAGASYPLAFLCFWHFLLQYFTFNQSRSHFLRQENDRPQTRRFFEVNLFYSLYAGSEKAPPRRVGQRGEASPVGGPLWFIAGPLMLASISSMPTRTQPSKKRAPFPKRSQNNLLGDSQ